MITATLESRRIFSTEGRAFCLAGTAIMATGKIVVLFVLLAICVALSYAGLWMEWRNRAVAVIQLVKSYKAAAITRPRGWLVND